MDGRGLTELRQISVDVGLLPRAHGTGLFTRGETQVLTIATLGSSSDVQRIDTISPKTEKRYIHHYNFPPYSTGENKPMRGPSRRDIGHGNLAERALIPVLPTTTTSRTSSGSCRSACRPTARPRWPRPAARPSP